MSRSLVIVRRFEENHPEFQCLEVELPENPKADELLLLLTPPSRAAPVRCTMNGRPYPPYPRDINHGASPWADFLVEVISPPSLGDWLLFALGVWLGSSRDSTRTVPEEHVGEEAARFRILMRRPILSHRDLVRTGYAEDRDLGIGKYEFRAKGMQYEVGVTLRNGPVELLYFYESTGPDAT